MEQNLQTEPAENRKPSFFKRFFAVLLVTVLLLAGAGYGAMYVLLRGPSGYAGSAAAISIARQPVACALLKLYLSDAELAEVEAAAAGAQNTENGNGEKLFSVFPNAE